MRQSLADSLYSKALTHCIQLEEPSVYRYSRGTILLVLTIVVAAIAWAAVTPVAEVARARAELVPSTLPHRIQFPVTGRIEAIHVKTGDLVDVGDLLVSLEPAAAAPRLEQARVRQVSLLLELERLQALLGGREPEFDFASGFEQLVVQQRLAYQEQREALGARRETLVREIARYKVEVRRYHNQVRALKPRVAALRKKMDMFDRLSETRSTPEVLRIDTQADLAQVEAESEEARGAAEIAESAVQGAYARLEELTSEIRRSWSLRASEVKAQLAEADQQVIEYEQLVASMKITAPVTGVAKITELAGVNGVVAAGEIIMEIVPANDRLVVTTLVETKDVGHLSVGQPARVRLDGFDDYTATRLDGHVTHISPSSHLDAEGIPRYHATVEMTRQQVEYRGTTLPIISGMTGDVEIVTGEKSVLAYVLNPITRGVRGAMSER